MTFFLEGRIRHTPYGIYGDRKLRHPLLTSGWGQHTAWTSQFLGKFRLLKSTFFCNIYHLLQSLVGGKPVQLGWCDDCATGTVVRIAARGNSFSRLRSVQGGSGVHSASCPMGNRGVLAVVQWLARDANHWPTCSAKDNSRSHMSACLRFVA